MKVSSALLLLLSWPCGLPAASGQETQPAGEAVSREEYESLKKEVADLKATISELRTTAASRPIAETEEEYCRRMRAQFLKEIMAEIEPELSGTIRMLIAGDAYASFTNQRHTDSTFGTDFSPLFLFQIHERVFLEAGLDFGLANTADDQGGETTVDLGPGNLSYLLNDYVALVGGQFTVPFGDFHMHLGPPWINKLPDDPLPFAEHAIAPAQGLGVMATGAFPIGHTAIGNYGVYVANGPAVITRGDDEAGALRFDNWEDINNNKAVGGRLGFLPIPGVEVGYSIQGARVNPDDFQKVHALLQALDLNAVRDCRKLRGRVTVRAEWVWSHAGSATYLPQPPLGFGRRFRNDRNGGYVELAYRPTMVSSRILQKFEGVIRYDDLHIPQSAPGGFSEHRITTGIDYWLTPSAVLKVAYNIDSRHGAEDRNALLLQFGLGF